MSGGTNSSMDSVALFKSMAKKYGATDEWIKTIEEEMRICTFALFFNASSYHPNKEDDMPLMKLVSEITKTAPNDPTREAMAVFRRLCYEAWVLSASDLRDRIERRNDDAPRSLMMPERIERNKNQKERIKGIRMKGHRQCSHHLVDLIDGMATKNVLQYVALKDCTTRAQELKGVKQEPYFATDPSTGFLKKFEGSSSAEAGFSSDGLLLNCLERRDLAFDNCRLVALETFSEWTDRLYECYIATPPPGFETIGLDQILEADQALFEQMAEMTDESGICPENDKFPLEEALVKAMEKQQVNLHLTYRRHGNSSASSRQAKSPEKRSRQPETTEDKKMQARITQLENTIKNLRSGKDSKAKKTEGKKDKGGGKGGKEGKLQHTRMPRELIGLKPQMPKGENEGDQICYGFNLGGCTKAAKGEKCARGWHVCMKCHKSSHGHRDNH